MNVFKGRHFGGGNPLRLRFVARLRNTRDRAFGCALWHEGKTLKRGKALSEKAVKIDLGRFERIVHLPVQQTYVGSTFFRRRSTSA